MKIYIDATNIKAGGGLTHLQQIVKFFDYNNDDELVLVGGSWLNKIGDRNQLMKKIFENDFKSLLKQEWFKYNTLPKILVEGVISFVPGGTFSSKNVSYVSMSQNMLVFDEVERNRFPRGITWLRYRLLEWLQVRSFKNSRGIIYISHYAKNFIEKKYPALKEKETTVIYHGISKDFRQLPKKQKPIQEYSKENPFKLLYISIVNFYKHQWNVIKAVKLLRKKGFPIELTLVGPMYDPARKVFEEALSGTENYVHYEGKVDYNVISNYYKESNLFIFASTCENMPNILVEAMSAGLPILCSSYGPMPEILKAGGVYMDPTQPKDIYNKLKDLIMDVKKRETISHGAYNTALNFSWEETSKKTFDFIKDIANNETTDSIL